MSIELFLLVSAVLFVILLVFLIPILLHAKRTLMSLDIFIRTTQESLNPLLLETKITMERLNSIAKDIEDSTKNIQRLTKSVGEAAAVIDEVNNFFKRTGLSLSLKAASFGAGIVTALSSFARGFLKKEPDENNTP